MRINVIGISGSGKTTFGKKLAEILKIPFLEMDAIFWGPNWVQPSDEIFFPKLTQFLEGEDWILDGNYTRTIGFKWDRVQAVVWLNFSFPRTVYQCIKRATGRLFSQDELWPGTGNRENFRMLFSRDSIVWYTITNYHHQVKRNFNFMSTEDFSHIKFHRLRNPRESREFLVNAEIDPQFIIQK
jgi:adenylate kinase family enzyme